jgi:hypothetical protein
VQNQIAGMKWAKFGLLSLAVIALLIFNGSTAMAQVSTASLSGTIEDASGSPIPGVMVTVTSLETSIARTATTDDSGAYRLLSLPVGRYDVKAEKAGFKTQVQTGINLVVGQQGVINLGMEVGQVTQQVTVSGEAAMVVNTTTASISGIVNEQEVKDLPLNGRSFDSLVTLNAGVVNFTGLRNLGGSGSPLGNRFSVSGRRPSENYFTLNGVEIAGPDLDATLPFGVSGQLLGVDSIREYNVLTTAYGSEYGMKAGGQVSVVTQSGTNQLHGALFEFLRNSVFDAKEFNQALNTPIPPFKRNQFGASAGGPIFKDKTFIFGNYEGLRYRLGQTVQFVAPDSCARQGLTTRIASGGLPASQITCGNPIPNAVTTGGPGGHGMLDYVNAYWPNPNGLETGSLPCVLDGTGTCIANPPPGSPNTSLDALGTATVSANPNNPIREDYGVLRVDHTISPKDALSAVFTDDNGVETQPISTNSVFSNAIDVYYNVFSLSETHTFSPNVLNTFTFGFSHVQYDNLQQAPSIPASLGLVKGVPGAGTITVGLGGGSATALGYVNSGGGQSASNEADLKSLFTYTDQVGWTKGKHQWSFGVWFQRQRDNGAGNSNDFGRVNFSEGITNIIAPITTSSASYLDMFQGRVAGGSAGFLSVPNEITHQWRQWVGAWFVQDQIQVRKNLTVRLGLRHEFTDGWNDPTGRGYNFVYGSDGILKTNLETGNSSLVQNNANLLFSPRVGIAWDVRGDGKTSVRASFGTYYDIQNDFSLIQQAEPPFNSISQLQNVNFLSVAPVSLGVPPTTPFCNGSNGYPSGTPGHSGAPLCVAYTPRGFDSNFKTPTIEEWELSVERQLTPTMSLRVAYNGSEGFHEVAIADPNTIAPLVCTTPPCTAGGLGATTSTVTTAGQLYIPVVNPVTTQYVTAGSPATRPNPFLGAGTFFFRFYGTSNYQAALVEIKKQVGSGLNFKANYTYSHNLSVGGLEGGGESGNSTNLMTPYVPSLSRGPAPIDFTHAVAISGSYDLPFGKGKRFGANSGGIVNNIIGGWQVNTIVSIATGYPLILVSGTNKSGNGDATNPDRPNYAAGFSSIPTSGVSNGCTASNGKTIAPGTPIGNATLWYDPCAVTSATAPVASGTWGNVPVGALRAPGWANMDMSFFKNFSFSERYKLQFRAEIFNLPNHTSLGNPSTNLSSAAPGSVQNSAQPYIFTQREIQFGLKFKF